MAPGTTMDASVVTALAALGGSMVGALSSFATTYFTQRHTGRRERINRELDRREALYGHFIEQAAALFIDSLDKTLEDPARLVELIAIVGRIRLSAPQEVIDASGSVMDELIASYNRPAVDPREVFARTRDTFTDPLAAFTAACRLERERMLALA